MTYEEMKMFVSAGFTKADIAAMIKPSDPETKPKEETKKEETKKEEPKAKPQPAEDKPSGHVTLSNEQFTALMQGINAKNASIDIPPERDNAQALNDHFKEILLGGK